MSRATDSLAIACFFLGGGQVTQLPKGATSEENSGDRAEQRAERRSERFHTARYMGDTVSEALDYANGGR